MSFATFDIFVFVTEDWLLVFVTVDSEIELLENRPVYFRAGARLSGFTCVFSNL